MRVLIDGTPLSEGGGVQVAIGLILNLQESEGFSWNAVFSEGVRHALPKIIAEDKRVAFFGKASFSDRFRLLVRLPKAVAALKPDVVFTVFGPAYFKAKVPHLVGFALPHMLYEDVGLGRPSIAVKLADIWRCYSLLRASHIVVETETIKNRLAVRLGFPRDRISVIGNSINPLLQPLGLADPSTRFRFLVPSAYYAHKNLEIVPGVAHQLMLTRPDLDFEIALTIPSDSRYWCSIAASATNLGVGNRVVTLGRVNIENLSAVYASASAVFLPTLVEASTAVYPESFFFRRPLVTSDRDFAKELCGNAALFVNPLDPGAIATALARVATSPELVTALVEAGDRQLALKYPTPQAKFSMQLKLLASLVFGRESSDMEALVRS